MGVRSREVEVTDRIALKYARRLGAILHRHTSGISAAALASSALASGRARCPPARQFRTYRRLARH